MTAVQDVDTVALKEADGRVLARDMVAPLPPRLRVTKGTPWRIDPGRRAKWSTREFVSANAVDVRQIGDPVLHAPAKKPPIRNPSPP